MRILMTGKGGKSGSWQIRGVQLGEAMGAEVFPQAEMAEMRQADIIVVVKRVSDRLLRCLRGSERPWVLDLVDGWPQPLGNAWPRAVAQTWLKIRLAELRPDAVVFPTSRMWQDSGWTGPAMVLPHHAWSKYQPRKAARQVARVGYEGAPNYLGRWKERIDAECRLRGWEFVVNGDLSTCDIGVALRDVSGYPAGAWKANTKLANLQALGIPAICSPEESYREFGSGLESFIDSPDDLAKAFDRWSSFEERVYASPVMATAAPRLQQVAEVFQGWLSQVAST